MATDIVMPNLGFDAQTGRLVEWLRQPGDTVQKGDIIAVIESDKANVDLESIASGVMLEQLHAAGEEVAVGQVIARIGTAGEQARGLSPLSQSTRPLPSSVTPSIEPAPQQNTPVEISPVAKRLATENQIDLSTVKGSGRGGRIMREDVAALLKKPDGNGQILALPKVRKAAREAGIALSQLTPTGSRGEITLADVQNYLRTERQVETPVELPPAIVEEQFVEREGAKEIPLSRLRQLIGKRLGKSKRKAPHFYVTGEFDIEAAMTKLKKLPEPQPRINDLLQYLTVQTLLRVPELNATYEEKRLYYHQSVHLAVAIAREDGLITPVIPHAENYSLQGLAVESRGVIQRARENRLKPEDLQGSTFTISNLGMIQQVDHFTAVINPPQVAILAVGTVKQRPVVIDGGLHIHHTVHLTLSGDHRVVDGMHLARFMAAFQAELDNFAQR